jgi:maltose phosphorylase
MAGTWMSIVEGMAGVRVTEAGLAINPTLPKQWNGYAFKIYFKGNSLDIKCDAQQVSITNNGSELVSASVYGNVVALAQGKTVVITR